MDDKTPEDAWNAEWSEVESLMTLDETPPGNLFIYALDTPTLFPGMIAPLQVEGEHAEVLFEQVSSQNRFLGFIAKTNPDEHDNDDKPIVPNDLHKVGVAGKLVKVLRLPDGSATALVQALARFEVQRWTRTRPFLIAKVKYPEETFGDPERTEAVVGQVQDALTQVLDLMPGMPEEISVQSSTIEEAAQLADFITAHFPLKDEERQAVVESFDISERLETVLGYLLRELRLREIGQRIQEDLREKIETQQKQFLLREQLKALKQELGEEMDEKEADRASYEEKIQSSGMPEEVEKQARKELKRMDLLPTESGEYHVIRTYLDWLTELPWSKSTVDNADLDHAKKVLDEDHYGLPEVKERILEALAVRKLKPDAPSPVICFVGPPGVGKTSLGRSIAKALGREFFRFSLGGMRDEAEIKGHRRTYVGAMPGKIVQGMKRAGSSNPVFMLDEIDKLGSDGRGDPSSAMLEVLDPAQNHAFLDHYLDVPVDLSKVMFIATANMVDQIPAPLRDRMEMISISGYMLEEKAEIAARYLLKRQRDKTGLTAKHLQIPKSTFRHLIHGWTREAGVRNLDRQVGRIARKVAVSVARDEPFSPRVSAARLPELLGPKKFESDMVDRLRRPGVAVGMAWTPHGGEILFIESTMMPGQGKLVLTGQLGEVMSESVRIGMSYVRSRAQALSIDLERFKENDFHVHFPAGATPKDGPSAGIAIATSLLSVLLGVSPKPNLSMTGELTLSGTVLPVGGIKEKVLGARRAGVKVILLPAQNEKDLSEVPDEMKEGLTLHLVDHFEEVLALVFDNVADQLLGSSAKRKARVKSVKSRSEKASAKGRK